MTDPVPTTDNRAVVVRPCSCEKDCESVAQLCANGFPEECRGQGLTVPQWSELQTDELKARPSWWRQIGLAWESSTVLGVVVLTVQNEESDSISWSEYSRRVGCVATVKSMIYDHVLEEPIRAHECLIDFIAVSPEARGKGVGSKLMQWAEAAALATLAEVEAPAVRTHGVDMILWVAADNIAACQLYQRCGYSVVKRTDSGMCHCLSSQVFMWFLGHPVWVKMHKQLPAPESLATGPCKAPQQASIELSVGAGRPAVSVEPQFETIPLDTPDVADQLQAAGAVSGAPRTAITASLFRSLSCGLYKPQRSPADRGGASGTHAGCRGGSPRQSTPRIAAAGVGARDGQCGAFREELQHDGALAQTLLERCAAGLHDIRKCSSVGEGQRTLRGATAGSCSVSICGWDGSGKVQEPLKAPALRTSSTAAASPATRFCVAPLPCDSEGEEVGIVSMARQACPLSPSEAACLQQDSLGRQEQQRQCQH